MDALAVEKPKIKKGFAGMSPEKRREIARRGGKKVQSIGTAHKFTPEELKRGGRHGGAKSRRRTGTYPGGLSPNMEQSA